MSALGEKNCKFVIISPFVKIVLDPRAWDW